MHPPRRRSEPDIRRVFGRRAEARPSGLRNRLPDKLRSKRRAPSECPPRSFFRQHPRYGRRTASVTAFARLTKMINSPTMNPNPQRAEPTATLKDYVDPPAEPEISTFDPYTWQESQAQSEFHGAGGRQGSRKRPCHPCCSLARLYRLGGRQGACGPADFIARGCAMACTGGRAPGPSRPVLDHVRAHASQGSGAFHPLGDRDARRSTLARRTARRPLPAHPGQPQRTDDDGAEPHAAGRRDDRQARRNHARAGLEHRQAGQAWRGARSSRGIGPNGYCSTARRSAACRGDGLDHVPKSFGPLERRREQHAAKIRRTDGGSFGEHQIRGRRGFHRCPAADRASVLGSEFRNRRSYGDQ